MLGDDDCPELAGLLHGSWLRSTHPGRPGSDYGEGVLRGALVALDRRKGVRSWQLVQG